MKPLQSHSKLIEFETRLSKQSYLSRSNLPGKADAEMFIYLEQTLKRYPDRKAYPNFYHWYILMKQFALSSLHKWISNNQHQETDPLLSDFMRLKFNERNVLDGQSFKKDKQPDASTEEPAKLARSQQYAGSSNEIEYIMDIKIKEGHQHDMKELVTDFLTKQQVQVQELNVITEEKRVRIVTKIDADKYEELKNKISHLEGVETFESKKKEKKFKTVNSLNNFLGQAKQ